METAILSQLVLTTLIGLFISLKNKGLIQQFISITLTIGILIIPFGKNTTLFLFGIILQTLILFFAVGYAILKRGVNPILRSALIISSILIPVITIFKVQHYPLFSALYYALLLPIALFFYFLFQKKELKNGEVGVAIIICGLAINRLIVFF